MRRAGAAASSISERLWKVVLEFLIRVCHNQRPVDDATQRIIHLKDPNFKPLVPRQMLVQRFLWMNALASLVLSPRRFFKRLRIHRHRLHRPERDLIIRQPLPRRAPRQVHRARRRRGRSGGRGGGQRRRGPGLPHQVRAQPQHEVVRHGSRRAAQKRHRVVELEKHGQRGDGAFVGRRGGFRRRRGVCEAASARAAPVG
mmetsp:Transcript_18111/g.45772  ORF Transcript_18111/g.45772 Transcript_18111/m.45772 type:complete len:200 (-) Transcript_18111:447-1046(-)